MSVYIDRKFLGSISHRLERFAQKNTDLYNFRCPYCLDSKKNRLKARGYIYRKHNDYFYRCHNCAKSISFGSFLKDIDPTAFREYTLERYTAGENGRSNYQKPTFDEFRGNAFAAFTKDTRVSIPSILDLPDDHPAKQYVVSRKIPPKFWKEIFYAEKFRTFMDTDFPDHGKEEIPDDERIVLLYTNESGDITNVAGRALGNSKIRYVTVKVSDEKKVFGLHRVSRKDRVYIFEGQFDSFFIENAVASGDSNLSALAEFLSGCDCILVFDNEPRNKDIVRQINGAIESNRTVCLFPSSIPYKDVNEMVINGMSIDEIKKIIDENTFSGLAAKLKFIEWKKC